MLRQKHGKNIFNEGLTKTQSASPFTSSIEETLGETGLYWACASRACPPSGEFTKKNTNTQWTSSKAYNICCKDIRSIPFSSSQLIDLYMQQIYKGKRNTTARLLCFTSRPSSISLADLVHFTPNHWLNTSNSIRFPSWHCSIMYHLEIQAIKSYWATCLEY